jgi:hypothetical protein
MQNYKAIEIVVIIVDDLYKFCPVSRLHIRGVERRIELIGGNAIVESFQLRNVLEQMVEIKVF